MDAHALLTSQGWRGSGNSLHPTDNSIGLSRPLLVSRKVDNLGIGKKQHRTSDMWWMNAFDSSLKGLDTSKEGQVVQTITSGGLDMVAKAGAKWVGSKGGLYASFVRGECLSGTLTPEESAAESGVEGKKRKRDDAEEESKEERRARRAAKKAMEEEDLLRKEKAERKEERSARRAAKKVAAEEVLAAENEVSEKAETKEQRKARRAAKRALKEQELKGPEVEETAVAATAEPESKEERKERKRLRKLAQESKDNSTDDSSEKSKKKKRRKD